MPSAKCPNCGHRIMLPTSLPKCPNCGAILPSQFVAEDASLTPMGGGGGGGRSRSSLGGSYVPPADDDFDSTPNENPFDASYAAGPGPSAGFSSPIINGTPMDPADNTRYPLSLPWWRKPDIRGMVIGLQPLQEVPLNNDWLTSLFLLFRDIVWPMSPHGYFQDRPQVDKINVTMVRVRRSDDSQRDARLIGHITGANISLGDEIALWGKKRRGSLYITKGFNHTSQAIIATTKNMNAPVPALVFLTILVVGYLIISVWLHISFFPFPLPKLF